jgi:transposase-like protein
MTSPTKPSYTGHRFPPEVIDHAVWLYFRFPLGLRMVEELLAAVPVHGFETPLCAYAAIGIGPI